MLSYVYRHIATHTMTARLWRCVTHTTIEQSVLNTYALHTVYIDGYRNGHDIILTCFGADVVCLFRLIHWQTAVPTLISVFSVHQRSFCTVWSNLCVRCVRACGGWKRMSMLNHIAWEVKKPREKTSADVMAFKMHWYWWTASIQCVLLCHTMNEFSKAWFELDHFFSSQFESNEIFENILSEFEKNWVFSKLLDWLAW